MQPFLWPSKFKRITTNVKFHLDGFFSAYTSEFKIESLFLHVIYISLTLKRPEINGAKAQ